MLRIPAGPDLLIFLPGFMSSASSYRELLLPVAERGISVLVPQLYPRGVGALLGRVTVQQEAMAAADIAVSHPGRVFLGGHSRGGQAAWVAAGLAAPAGLCLVDPVDGEGRRPGTPTSTSMPSAFQGPALVIGAGRGGRCAPVPVNFEQFARATPTAQLKVIPEMGHADMLCGRARSFGRRLCPGGPDPDASRQRCSELVCNFLAGL